MTASDTFFKKAEYVQSIAARVGGRRIRCQATRYSMLQAWQCCAQNATCCVLRAYLPHSELLRDYNFARASRAYTTTSVCKVACVISVRHSKTRLRSPRAKCFAKNGAAHANASFFCPQHIEGREREHMQIFASATSRCRVQRRTTGFGNSRSYY